jgi:hypothetical protein
MAKTRRFPETGKKQIENLGHKKAQKAQRIYYFVSFCAFLWLYIRVKCGASFIDSSVKG